MQPPDRCRLSSRRAPTEGAAEGRRMTTNHLIVWLRSRHNELDSQLKTVTVGRNHILFDVGEIVGSIYFPLDAIVSLVVPLQSGKMIEAAMVGRDGVVGASAALDG